MIKPFFPSLVSSNKQPTNHSFNQSIIQSFIPSANPSSNDPTTSNAPHPVPPDLLGSSVLIERIRRIEILVTEAQLQFGHALRLLVVRQRQLGADIVHLQLADRVDVALEVVLAQILHHLLYTSHTASGRTSLAHQRVHVSLRTEILRVIDTRQSDLVMVPQMLRQTTNALGEKSNYKITSSHRRNTLNLRGASVIRLSLELGDDFLLFHLE